MVDDSASELNVPVLIPKYFEVLYSGKPLVFNDRPTKMLLDGIGANTSQSFQDPYNHMVALPPRWSVGINSCDWYRSRCFFDPEGNKRFSVNEVRENSHRRVVVSFY